MRARNIKPGFFSDEKIINCSHSARLLFIGLWCIADREGRFLWKPSQIRVDIFPDQPDVDVITLLGELSLHGLTLRYTIEGQTYGCLPHFKDHQYPHPHEVESKIPPFSKEYQCHDKLPLHYTAVCPSDIMNPDIMNPDIMNPDIMNPDSTPYSPPKTKSNKTPLPDFISPELFQDFREMRKSIKKVMTPKAEQLIIQKLIKLQTDGEDIQAVIEQSIRNNWQDVFPVKEKKHANNKTNRDGAPGFFERNLLKGDKSNPD